MREIVLDTETTGLDHKKGDRLVELGCVEIVNRIPTGREFHTFINPDGRQVHVELGIVDETHYLYCANTFDQRQLVLMEEARAALLEAYYQEIIRGLP